MSIAFGNRQNNKSFCCSHYFLFTDGYFMVIKEEDHLCQACQDLMSTIQSKGAELRTMTLAMRALLRIKYSLDFQNVGMLVSQPVVCMFVIVFGLF